MKNLANRTRMLMQSDIRAVTQMINAVDGINLGQGICDLPTPEPIKTGAKKAINENKSIYTSYAGIQSLRNSLVKKAQSFNKIPCTSAEEIVVSAGSTGAFVTALFTLLEPNDEVVLFEPFYGYHKNLLNLLGTKQRFVPMRGAQWAIDFQEVEATLNQNTKFIILNTPSNPCGKVWQRQELQQLLALAQKYDCYIITDEIYEYMTYDGREHISMASLPEAYERTITISGFSKTYNMTGWRLGYAIAPPAISEKMGLINDLLYICAPSPLQYGVAEAFSMPDTYFKEMMEAYNQKRTLMCNTLQTIGFEIEPPQGAYYAFANFQKLSQQRKGFSNDKEACKTLIQKAHVGTVAGNSFFDNPADGTYFLRFCYAKEMPILEEACHNLIRAFG